MTRATYFQKAERRTHLFLEKTPTKQQTATTNNTALPQNIRLPLALLILEFWIHLTGQCYLILPCPNGREKMLQNLRISLPFFPPLFSFFFFFFQLLCFLESCKKLERYWTQIFLSFLINLFLTNAWCSGDRLHSNVIRVCWSSLQKLWSLQSFQFDTISPALQAGQHQAEVRQHHSFKYVLHLNML